MASAPRRLCFRDPVPEIAVAAQCLDDAVSAHLARKPEMASELIHRADMPEIYEWTASIWLCKPPYVNIDRSTKMPPILPKAQRLLPRMPGWQVKAALFKRDGYRCRFCGVPVIRSEVRKALMVHYQKALRWTSDRSHPEQQHSAFQALEAHYDHVLPHSRGGASDLTNMVITCAPCNYGRDCWTLEAVGLADPRERKPIRSTWDGLERVLIAGK